MEKVKIKLRNGLVVEGDKFDMGDYKKLKEIFRDWVAINAKLKPLGGRGLNVPDVFSEALFCIFFNAIRTNGTAYSYDCVSLDTHAGIQVKSASIPNDCTSFGPTSTWDEIYYVDFYNDGERDGKFKVYDIPITYIINAHVNSNQTITDQSNQARRPRISIKDIILNHNINGTQYMLTNNEIKKI